MRDGTLVDCCAGRRFALGSEALQGYPRLNNNLSAQVVYPKRWYIIERLHDCFWRVGIESAGEALSCGDVADYTDLELGVVAIELRGDACQCIVFKDQPALSLTK